MSYSFTCPPTPALRTRTAGAGREIRQLRAWRGRVCGASCVDEPRARLVPRVEPRTGRGATRCSTGRAGGRFPRADLCDVEQQRVPVRKLVTVTLAGPRQIVAPLRLLH